MKWYTIQQWNIVEFKEYNVDLNKLSDKAIYSLWGDFILYVQNSIKLNNTLYKDRKQMQ